MSKKFEDRQKEKFDQKQRGLGFYSSLLHDYSMVWGSNAPPAPPPAPKPAFEPTIETVVEAITGWRQWRAKMWDDEVSSLHKDEVWPVKKALKASCKISDQSYGIFSWGPRTCSGVSCSCGVYAYKTLDQLKQETSKRTCVHDPAGLASGCPECKKEDIFKITGEVKLWGRIVVHETGYRAQYAYPASFVNTGPIAQRLAEAYGIKLIEEPR